MSEVEGFEAMQQMLARARLSIDACDAGRTTFLSHLGATEKLVPGAWIGHRDLLYALALANLTPAQRRSLARAVLVEHGREFGVGRLVLEAVASGLPFGGSSLRIAPRGDGERCFYTWGLGSTAQPRPCDWLLLRAQPEWAVDAPPRPLSSRGLATLAELGGETLLLLPDPIMARQVADLVGDRPVSAHPRFSPHLDTHAPHASLILWPHDAVGSPGLSRVRPHTVVLVSAPERVTSAAEGWIAGLGHEVERVHATVPGTLDRSGVGVFWAACGEPKVALRGDPAWTRAGAAFLREIGTSVVVQSEALQLGLF